MNYSDKYKVLWATPIRTASRSCMPIQTYFEFDVIGLHGLQIPKGKEEYFFVLNIRNPYIRMISIYHLFCNNFNLIPNNFNNWIRENLVEEIKYHNQTLNYQFFLKNKINSRWKHFRRAPN